jgi:hypothetical protein
VRTPRQRAKTTEEVVYIYATMTKLIYVVVLQYTVQDISVEQETNVAVRSFDNRRATRSCGCFQ